MGNSKNKKPCKTNGEIAFSQTVPFQKATFDNVIFQKMSNSNQTVKNKIYELLSSGFVGNIVAIISAVTALIVSIFSCQMSNKINSFTMGISPVNCELISSDNIDTINFPNIVYTASPCQIQIKNTFLSGDINKIYLACVSDNKIDIQNITPTEHEQFLYFENTSQIWVQPLTTKDNKDNLTFFFSLPINKKTLTSICYGSMYLLFKDYNHNYNIYTLFYMCDDIIHDTDSVKYTDMKYFLFETEDLYNRSKINELLNKLNKKNYIQEPLTVDLFTADVEADIELIEEKLKK